MTLQRVAGVMLALAVTACKGGGEDAPPPPPPPPPLLPAPLIEKLAPRAIVPGSATWFGVEGRGFGGADYGPPAMTAIRIRDLDGNPVIAGDEVSAAGEVVNVAGGKQRSFMEIDAASMAPGVYAIVVRNAEGREARHEDAFVLLPPPSVTAAEDRICLDGSTPTSITIDGVDLYRVPTIDPGVDLRVSFPRDGSAPRVHHLAIDSVSGCRPVPFELDGLELCTRVVARLPAEALPVRSELAVQLPGLPPERFGLVRPLWIERPTANPAEDLGARAVVDGPLEVPVWHAPVAVGPGFEPSARIDGAPLALRAMGCAPSGVPWTEVCASITAAIPQGFAPGAHTIDVTTISGCSATHSIFLGPQPVVTSVSPQTVCQGRQTFRVGGDRFFRESLLAGSTPVPARAMDGARTCVSDAGVPMCVELFAAELPVGVHELRIQNGTSPPVRSNAVSLTVTPGPPRLADQPRETLLFSGATRPVFVAATGVTGAIVGAELVPAFEPGPAVPVEARAVSGGAEVVFPALGGNGAYDVVLHDESPCPSDPTSYPFWVQDEPVIVSEDFETGLGSVSTASPGWGVAPPAEWLADGSPGSSARAVREGPGPEWYFQWYPATVRISGADLGSLRFLLRASGEGDPSSAPGVVLLVQPSAGTQFRLERALAAPTPGAWTSFAVPLDDPSAWTYRGEFSGEVRPATIADFRETIAAVWVRGSWWTGRAEAALDGFSLELAR